MKLTQTDILLLFMTLVIFASLAVLAWNWLQSTRVKVSVGFLTTAWCIKYKPKECYFWKYYMVNGHLQEYESLRAANQACRKIFETKADVNAMDDRDYVEKPWNRKWD